MKNVMVSLFCLGAVSSAMAAESYDYSEVSRKSGGSTFEESNVGAFTDKVELIAAQGRLELEDIQIYSGDEYKADLLSLMDEDSRNKALGASQRFFSAQGRPGEPKSLVIFLPRKMTVTDLVIRVESWAAGSVLKVKLGAGSAPRPPPSPPPVVVVPVNPPVGPTCDSRSALERILQCTTDKSSIEIDNQRIENSLVSLRSRLAEQNTRVNQCLRERDNAEAFVVDLEARIQANVQQVRNNIDSNRQIRRNLHHLENPVPQWNCFVISRKGRRWEKSGENRAQLLQGLVRMCMMSSEQDACGDKKWNPNSQGRWGCTPVRDIDGNIDFSDREDLDDMPEENEGRRRGGGNRDHDGSRRPK